MSDPVEVSRAQFDRQAACYGSGHILRDVSDVAAALDGFGASLLSPALDVATGAGHTAAYLAGRGMEVTAADISEGMLGEVRKLAAERGLVIATRQHAAEKLPYPDGSFGLVACRVAAHHFADVEAFLCEAFRLLRPGGLSTRRRGGPHLHAHRRQRQSLARSIHFHGRDERDGQYSPSRFRQELGDPR